MLDIILLIIKILVALTALILGAVRIIECINELSKKPELNSIGKIWQVVKNFCTIEKYKQAEI